MPQPPTLDPIDESVFERTPEPTYNPPPPSAYGQHYSCRHCGSTQPPTVLKRVSSGGWIFFFIFLLVCLPISFFGLGMKEEYRVCPMCGGHQW